MKVRSIGAAAATAGCTGGAIAAAAALVASPGPGIAGHTGMAAAAVYAGVGLAGAGIVAGVAYWAMRKFVVYKIKPIYQVVLSRDVKTRELEHHLTGRHDMVDRIGSELTARAESGSRELERLKDRERYRREFLGDISHEMRTPIFNIQGYILTLLDGAVDDPQVNRRYLERSEKSIDRMIDIVNDLEEIAQLESGTLELRPERFDIVEMTHDVAEDASMEAEKQGITVVVDSESPVWVTADRRYIRQIMANLMVNSVKYGRGGGCTRISFIDLFDKVMVEVSDNGVGMSAEETERVFERFYRTDRSRSREMGGSGLGLSIAKHIVEAHGEHISVRSQPARGSTFSFTLRK